MTYFGVVQSFIRRCCDAALAGTCVPEIAVTAEEERVLFDGPVITDRRFSWMGHRHLNKLRFDSGCGRVVLIFPEYPID